MDDTQSVFGPFSVAVSESGIAVAVFDVAGEKQNILRERYLVDCTAMLDHVERDPSITGLIIESGKQDSFIAGADVHMLFGCRSREEASSLSRSGQKLFGRIESLRVPVVAAIGGACLGGGLELALACHARVCSDEEKTILAVPEVRLGLLPGSGGTQRLPRLIGIQKALQLMLTGRRLSPQAARRQGVVDEVVPRSILRQVAFKSVFRLQDSKRRRERRSVGQRLLEGNAVGRSVLFSQARKSAAKKSGGHYPAPSAIIDCVERGITNGIEEGMRFEAEKFGELAMTSQARSLMSLFLATTELKRETGVDEDIAPRNVDHVGVLGAGLMGAGIAYVSSVVAGVDVRLKDQDNERTARGLAHVASRLEKTAKRQGLSDFERTLRIDRVTATVDYSGFEKADLVIEAVFEDLDLKQRMVADIEAVGTEDVIFATNTSSIPVAQIAATALRPQSVVGMHYFSPVEKMPLLEVVAAESTSQQTIATAVEFGKRQGKTVIVVKDGPGFYVNRILAPYLNEATNLLLAGEEIQRIDSAMKAFGFPLGPFELMDEVGLDVGSKVIPVLEAALGETARSSGVIEKMVEQGRLGKKTGEGFYDYGKNGKRTKPFGGIDTILDITSANTLQQSEIQERCVLLMIQESARCLAEGVIRSARDGDVGAVFGIGFPPFIGGPFRYVDLVGVSRLVAQLGIFASDVGARYEPLASLVDMADRGLRFHEGPKSESGHNGKY